MKSCSIELSSFSDSDIYNGSVTGRSSEVEVVFRHKNGKDQISASYIRNYIYLMIVGLSSSF